MLKSIVFCLPFLSIVAQAGDWHVYLDSSDFSSDSSVDCPQQEMFPRMSFENASMFHYGDENGAVVGQENEFPSDFESDSSNDCSPTFQSVFQAVHGAIRMRNMCFGNDGNGARGGQANDFQSDSDNSFDPKLFSEIRSGNILFVEEFINKNPKALKCIDRNGTGHTPLGAAVYYGQTEIVDFLLNKGANVFALDANGRNLLFIAANEKYADIIEQLFDKIPEKQYKCFVELKDKEGFTPLIWSARNGKLDAVDVLIEKGADIFAKDWSGRTAFSHAAETGNELILKRFLCETKKCKKLVDLADTRFNTPLMFAASQGQKGVVQLLLKHHSDKEATNLYGKTAFDLAQEKGHNEIADMLMDHKKHQEEFVESSDGEDNISSLMFSVRSGDFGKVDALVDEGADIWAQDQDGRTALSYAAERGDVAVVKTLLCAAGTPKQRKKLVNLADNENNTPLKFAKDQGHKKIVQLLLENGAH